MRPSAKSISLAELIEAVQACHDLPAAVRTAILAMIRATGGAGER